MVLGAHQQERVVLDNHWLSQRANRSPCNESFFDPTEQQLIARMATGDRLALRTLYWLYFPRLARFFAHLTTTTTAEIIERLINDTILGIWRASGSFESNSSVYAWIMSLALVNGRAYLDRGSDRRHTAALDLPDAGAAHIFSGTTQEWQSLRGTLASLGVMERAVVHFAYTGCSRHEIAAILHVSCERVDEMLTRARLGLQVWLKQCTESQRPEVREGAV